MTRSKWALVCPLALTLAAPATGQVSSGGIRGLVRDAQGAAVAGATLDIGCGRERLRVRSSESGQFAVTGLPPGRCNVTARSESFEPETVVVDSASGAVATLVLQVRTFTAEVVVTTTRGIQESAFDAPEALSVISRRDIGARPFRLLPQLLQEEAGVLVQQTTSAQTSPIIRGFTGQGNVYLVDGVRLNTGAWRAGPSQYTAWVHPGVVDSIEIVRGSGSVQYGSDALGGAVQFRSASPLLGVAATGVHGAVELDAASADLSVGGQAEVGFQLPAVSARFGGSHHTLNDLRPGGGVDSHAAVTRFLGLPSTILGSRQRDTSFVETGAFAVGDASPQAGAVLHALFMHAGQSGASRYDRILGGQGLFRSGFDPQTLDFGLLRYSRASSALLNGGLSATFSLNRQADGRFEQARPSTRLDRQSAATTALGYQLQAYHHFAQRYELLVGGEYYDERTAATRELIDTDGTRRPARPDIPDGTTYTNLGLFAQQSVDVIADRVRVRGGVRYSSFGFSARPDEALGVIEDDVTMRSMTFQAAAVANVSPAVNVTLNVSRAFRAANAADLGGIGLTGGGGFEITPSRAAALGALVGSSSSATAISTGAHVGVLRPEVVYQYDVGLKIRRGRLGASVNGFNMELFDFLQRRALVFETHVVGTTIAGFEIVRQDASGLAYIAQDIRPIATNVNTDRARIVGLDAEGELRLPASWTARAYFSIANGRTLPDGEFVRRMAPPMGGGSIRWTGERLWAEGVVTFAAEQTRLNGGDLSDARIGALRTRASIATFFNEGAADLGLVRGGVLLATGETLRQVQDRILGAADSAPLYESHPGFVAVGARAGLRLSAGVDVAVMLENLGDVNYRHYGSGIDAPGVNVQVRTRVRF